MNNVVKEEWKDIEDFEGYYQVSNHGRIKSLVGWNGKQYIKREKILKPSTTSTGYLKVDVKKNKKRKSMRLHRLIALAFIPNTDNKPQINHLDGNPLNNKISNLEWSTQRENVIHAIKNGLKETMRIPEEKLRNLYLMKGMNALKISRELNIPVGVVHRHIKKYGIKKKTHSEAMIQYGLTEEFILKELEIKTQKQLADEIGCDPSLISHYLKKIRERGKIYA